jgi:hypothetical protein
LTTTFLGLIGALVIFAGTWLYVAGLAPPFPLNAWLFNGAVVLSIGLAVAGGR